MNPVDMYREKNKKTDKEIKKTLKSIDKGLNKIGKSFDKSLNKIHKEAEWIRAEEKREKEKREKEVAKQNQNKRAEQYMQNKAYIKSLYDDLMANQKVVNTSNNPENVRKGLDNMLDILKEFEEIGEETLEYYGLEINCKETSDMILKNYKQVIEQARERSQK